MTPAAREAIDLGRKLASLHLGVSILLFGWLIIARSGPISANATDIAWSVLVAMHLPLAATYELGLFGSLSWWATIPLAALLVAAGTIGWAFATAGLIVFARRSRHS